MLDELVPLYVQNQFYRALGETAAAEHGARRTAMKNATDAGQDMLTLLQRTFNPARQAQITQELAEIVGGAEALKGLEMANIGKVVQVIGTVLDVEFEPEQLPELYIAV